MKISRSGRISSSIAVAVSGFFPKNVWFETANGWASRPATAKDFKRRAAYLMPYMEKPRLVGDASDKSPKS